MVKADGTGTSVNFLHVCCLLYHCAMDANKFTTRRTRSRRSHPPGFQQEQLMSLCACASETYKHFSI